MLVSLQRNSIYLVRIINTKFNQNPFIYNSKRANRGKRRR